MIHEFKAPDPILGGMRSIIIDDELPDFSGENTLIADLFDITQRDSIDVPPGVEVGPIDWTGPEGVLTALVALNPQFEAGGNLHGMLPKALQKATTRQLPEFESVPDRVY